MPAILFEERKLGIVEVSTEWIENFWIKGKFWQFLASNKFTVIDVTYQPHTNTIVLIMFHEDFETVEDGNELPKYDIILYEDEDKILMISEIKKCKHESNFAEFCYRKGYKDGFECKDSNFDRKEIFKEYLNDGICSREQNGKATDM